MDSESTSPQAPPPESEIVVARRETAEAIAELGAAHRLSWYLKYPTGEVWWVCSCDNTHRSHDVVPKHLQEAFRKKRGPVRGPAKK